MKTIINYGTENPTVNSAVDTTQFPNTEPSYYWSSTTLVDNSGKAWLIRFNRGTVDNADKSITTPNVRCVARAP